MAQTITTARTKDMDRCIQNCTACAAACEETSIHCLDLGGEHAGLEHQRVLRDCAEICRTSADFMLRGSPHHAAVCRACAELCEACGTSCGDMAGGDDVMTRCAEVCRRCAESCRSMASQG